MSRSGWMVRGEGGREGWRGEGGGREGSRDEGGRQGGREERGREEGGRRRKGGREGGREGGGSREGEKEGGGFWCKNIIKHRSEVRDHDDVHISILIKCPNGGHYSLETLFLLFCFYRG